MNRRSLEVGILSAFALLLISRSTLLPSWASQLAPLLAFSLVIAGVLPHIRGVRIPGGSSMLLLALTGTYAAASAASGSLDNFLRAFSIGCLWFATYVIGYNLREPEKRRIFVVVVVVAVIEAAIAVGETLLALPGIRANVSATQDGSYLVRPNTILGPWTNRAQGTVGYPIPFSHLLSLSAVIVLFAPLKWRFLKRLPIAVVMVFGVVLSGTRSGVAAVAACVLVGVFLLLKARYSGVKYLLLALMGLAAFAAAAYISSQESLAGDGSYTHRVGVLGSVFEILKLPAERVLFGSGINSHESLFVSGYFVGDGTYAVDNSFVTLLIYTGVVGLACFVGLVLLGFIRGSVDEAVALSGFMVFAMSYDYVNWHLLAFMFFLTLGLAHRKVPRENLSNSIHAADSGRMQFI